MKKAHHKGSLFAFLAIFFASAELVAAPAPLNPAHFFIHGAQPSSTIESKVDLIKRGEGFIEAFEFIKEEFPDRKIYMMIKGASLSNITHLEKGGDGSLLRVHYKSGKRIRIKTVKVEDIEEISHW